MEFLFGILGKAALFGLIGYLVRGALLYTKTHHEKRSYPDAICELYKSGYERLFFIMGLAAAALYALILSLPKSKLGPSTADIRAGFLLSIAFLFLVSFLFHRWHFIVIDGKLLYRSALGTAQEIPMSQLTGYKIGNGQELIIYKNGKKFIVIEDGDNKYEAMWGLSKYQVPDLDEKKSSYTVRTSRKFLLFMAGCAAVMGGMIFVLGVLSDGVNEGLELLGTALTAGMILYFYKLFGLKVKVEDNCFYVKRPFQKMEEKIPFSAIRKVRTGTDGHSVASAHYSFYLHNDQIAFQVLQSFANVHRLEKLIHKIKWLKKD